MSSESTRTLSRGGINLLLLSSAVHVHTSPYPKCALVLGAILLLKNSGRLVAPT